MCFKLVLLQLNITYLKRVYLVITMDPSEPNPRNGLVPSNFAADEAPWIPVPSQSIVSVEHPYIIRNIEKGLQSLGDQPKRDKVDYFPPLPLSCGIDKSVARRKPPRRSSKSIHETGKPHDKTNAFSQRQNQQHPPQNHRPQANGSKTKTRLLRTLPLHQR